MPLTTTTTQRPEEFAAIDLGSNSFHMMVARVVNGAMHVLNRLKQRVHLADGLDGDHRLSDEAMERGLSLPDPVRRTPARFFAAAGDDRRHPCYGKPPTRFISNCGCKTPPLNRCNLRHC